MWGRIRIRVVIWAYAINWSIWFWITLYKSAVCLCFGWPFTSQQANMAVLWFTVLFVISCWELAAEED